VETVGLRPLSLGELLDRTFQTYRHNFWMFVGDSLVVPNSKAPFWLLAALVAPHGDSPIWLNMAASLSIALGRSLTSPLLMTVRVLFYYDLRIPKEGFDLQFIMASPDSTPPVTSTVSSA
jgi:hypothetical protein